MFFREESRNKKNIIGKSKNYQMKSDFIEKNIIIPDITNQMNTISLLFKEMEEIYTQLQIENSESSQEFIKDSEAMMIDYYRKKFPTSDLNIKTQIEEEARNGAKEARKLLLDEISNHFNQYIGHLNNLGQISVKEESIEKITEYMIRAKSFMFNTVQLKEKIFNILMPMTTMIMIDSKTKEEIRRTPVDHPIKKIGLLPFETRIDEIALWCENGIKSIDSWFNHLKNKRVQYLETVVNQSKVQAAQEQAKAAKWTFRTQLGFMVLSVFFIIVSFCLAEYKEEWVDFFTDKKSINKTLVEKEVLLKQPSINKGVKRMEEMSTPNKKRELKEVPSINKDKVQK